MLSSYNNVILLLILYLSASVKCCKPEQFKYIKITEKLTRSTHKANIWKEASTYNYYSDLPLVIANEELPTCRVNIQEYEQGLKTALEITIHLHEIPILLKGDVQNLHSLYKISLEDNNIDQIEPGAFQDLTVIDSIHLDYNYIKEISAGVFNNLNTLKTISLSNNIIEHIATDAFNGLNDLIKINLSNNKLANWDEKWFANTPNLQNVLASHNQLTSIPKESFKAFKSTIRRIDFSNNRIVQVYAVLFENTVNLNYLDLSHNKLECLDKDVLNTFKKPTLIRLNILDNVGVGCTCMINMQKWTLENNIGLDKETNVEFEKYLQVKCNEKIVEMLENELKRISALERKS